MTLGKPPLSRAQLSPRSPGVTVALYGDDLRTEIVNIELNTVFSSCFVPKYQRVLVITIFVLPH